MRIKLIVVIALVLSMSLPAFATNTVQTNQSPTTIQQTPSQSASAVNVGFIPDVFKRPKVKNVAPKPAVAKLGYIAPINAKKAYVPKVTAVTVPTLKPTDVKARKPVPEPSFAVKGAPADAIIVAAVPKAPEANASDSNSTIDK